MKYHMIKCIVLGVILLIVAIRIFFITIVYEKNFLNAIKVLLFFIAIAVGMILLGINTYQLYG